jgi:hypothetical protein
MNRASKSFPGIDTEVWKLLAIYEPWVFKPVAHVENYISKVVRMYPLKRNARHKIFLTFICLRWSYILYDLGSRTIRSWRQNSVRCFSQCWTCNALRNRVCGGACCGRNGGRDIIINAIRWGAWCYSIVLNACRVTSMADTGIDAVKKQMNAEYAKQ